MVQMTSPLLPNQPLEAPHSVYTPLCPASISVNSYSLYPEQTTRLQQSWVGGGSQWDQILKLVLSSVCWTQLFRVHQTNGHRLTRIIVTWVSVPSLARPCLVPSHRCPPSSQLFLRDLQTNLLPFSTRSLASGTFPEMII